MKLDSTKPFRLSERNFRRFEHAIYMLVKNGTVMVDPSPLAAETYACRFRDAVRSYLDPHCLWESEIDKKDLKSVWNNVQVTHDGSTVFVKPRSKHAIGSPVGAVKDNEDGSPGSLTLTIDRPTEMEFKAAALLCDNDRLVNGVKFTNCELSEEFLQSLESKLLNIGINRESDGTIIMY